MKLLLVLPRSERGFWGKVENGKCGMARLALTVLASLTPDDWDVEIVDSRAREVDYNAPADLVGITGFTSEIPHGYEIADKFRKRGVPVVMGGIHVSSLPEEALEHADAVLVGEAEGIWRQILDDLKSGKMKGTYKPDMPCDMQQMAIPRRDLLKREMYVTGYYTLQATRGCPFDCEYCAITGMFGREFRKRPVAEVIDEIRSFDSNHFFFLDDNICGQPAYAKELFEALIPLNKKWGGQTSITFARDPELLDLYAKSGGQYAFIGFETLTEEQLKNLNKGWNQADDFGAAIKRIHAAGVNVLGSFIVGLDDDTPESFDRILEFIDGNDVDAAQFHILTPLPGTRLYDKMKADGRVISEDWSRYHTGETVFKPINFTPEELQNRYYQLWRDTYTWGRVLKRILRSPRGIIPRAALNIGYRRKAMRMPSEK